MQTGGGTAGENITVSYSLKDANEDDERLQKTCNITDSTVNKMCVDSLCVIQFMSIQKY